MSAARGIIFDLDDTLCDWQAAQRAGEHAINRLLQLQKLHQQLFWQHFHAVNESLHSQFALGKISKQEYRLRRFATPLQQQQVIDASLTQHFNRVFMQAALDAIRFITGAQQAFQLAVQQGYWVAILTNGSSESQRNKLLKLGIDQHAHAICISEETGIGKPHAAAFKHACQQIGCQPKHCLMVGDSWHNDIAPARALGMATYRINPQLNTLQQQDGVSTGSLPVLVQYLQAGQWYIDHHALQN